MALKTSQMQTNFKKYWENFKLGEKKETLINCPICGGDGKETCSNPDHGLINGMGGFEISRLGCPVCGHDPEHKVPDGGICDFCNGTGEVTEKKAEELGD